MSLTLTMRNGVAFDSLDGVLLEDGKQVYVIWPDDIIESHEVKTEHYVDPVLRSSSTSSSIYLRAYVTIRWHGSPIKVHLTRLVLQENVRVSWSQWR